MRFPFRNPFCTWIDDAFFPLLGPGCQRPCRHDWLFSLVLLLLGVDVLALAIVLLVHLLRAA